MLPKKIQHYIRQHSMWKPNDVILVSVSGGVDSMSLLHVLYHTRAMHKGILKVVTFDHGLRDESKDEVEMVANYCCKYDIPCQIIYLHLTKCTNLMEIAREKRRMHLESIDSFRIVTGHHMNDQAETILYRMLRGSGLDGVSGMLPVQGRYCRPMLNVQKEEIISYAKMHQIPFVNDPSNSKSMRGKLREILSCLEDIHGPSIPSFSQSARSLARDSDYLITHTNRLWSEWSIDVYGIPISKFNDLHFAIQIRLLRKLLHHHTIPIRYKQLEQFLLSPLHNGHRMTCPKGYSLLVVSGYIVVSSD